MSADHVATARPTWGLLAGGGGSWWDQPEMGRGGSRELPVVDTGGEQGALATQLLQATGIAHPEQWALWGRCWSPPGQGWVGAYAGSTAG